jgi:Tol biopolymer transport system component
MPREWPGAGAPDWSPDGRLLLYSTYCYFGDCGQPRTGAQLFTVHPDGSGARQVTDLTGNSYNPRWSPDGRQIVFARNARLAPEGDIYIIRADGTHLQQVTDEAQLDAHKPDWGRATS